VRHVAPSAPPDGASRPGHLISVGELSEAVAQGDRPTLLDVRWRLGGPPGIDSYRAGHLPGAVFLDLDRQLAGSPGDGGRHPLPATQDVEAALRGAGVTDGADVVVYDDADATIAARLWWMLRFYGHERVRVLDGGFRAWAAAGLPVSTQDEAATPGDFTAKPGQCWTRPGPRSWPGPASCSTRERLRGIAARPSQSTRWPATSPER
jgi:thiosulfate/3-mercaptopyruvate sulfurtransferase